MKDAKQAEQQEANGSDSREVLIQRLLRQRAKERAAPLRWSVDSVILGYVCLATVIIMSLKEVALAITILTAFLGIALVWLSSWLRIRKLENKFHEEEVDDYAELSRSKSSKQSRTLEAQSLVSSAESPLTPRELAVLEQMAKGTTNKEIASALQISSQTVKNHISHILWKLNVSDRTAAVLAALHRGWIKLDR